MTIYTITPVGPAVNQDHLQQCIDSVSAQDCPAEVIHILVFDCPLADADIPDPAPAHLRWLGLPSNTNDIGSTPRTVGTAYAWGAGADAVTFLDADCTYKPDHLCRLITFHDRSQKPVICSGREIISLDGTHRAPCPEMVPGSGFYDTNTFLFTRGAIGISYTFGTLTGREQHKIGDRILSERAAPFLACHYHPTVVYRSIHEFHYHRFGWPVPQGVTLKNLSRPEPAHEPA